MEINRKYTHKLRFGNEIHAKMSTKTVMLHKNSLPVSEKFVYFCPLEKNVCMRNKDTILEN